MRRSSAVGLFAVAVAMLAIVASAQAGIVRINGRAYGVMPGRVAQTGSTRQAAGIDAVTPFATGLSYGDLSFHGGPVLHTASPYLIFWDPTHATTPQISTHSLTVLNQYMTDIATDSGETDSVYGVARQYYDGAGIAAAGMTFSAAQSIIDTQPYPTTGNCTVASGFTACLTDAQLQAEVSRLIATDGLPTDGPTSATEPPAGAPIYFILVPVNVDTCVSGGNCVSNGSFCAYHSSYVDAGNNVIYSDVPFSVFNAAVGGTKGCQTDGNSVYQSPNDDQADNIADDLSHELTETFTDPFVDAWSSSSGNEIADNCESYSATSDPASGQSNRAYVPLGGSSAAGVDGFGNLYDQLINGNQYYTQSAWSNGDADCEMQPTSATLTPSFTDTSAAPGQTVTLDPTASISSAGLASETWDFGDGSTSFVPGGLTATTHIYATAGLYTVKLTLVDQYGNLAATTKQVAVGANPTAAIGSLPASVTPGSPVSFSAGASSDPNAGASTSYSWNFGDGASATGVTATHAYGTPGAYTVTLTVSDSYGFSSSTTATVNVVAAPAHPAQVGTLGRVGSTHTRTSAYALVTVTGPGTITYARHTTTVTKAGTVRIKLRLTAHQRKLLKHHRKFKLTITLSYAPVGGPTSTRVVHLTV